jgi:hypothetical protein
MLIEVAAPLRIGSTQCGGITPYAQHMSQISRDYIWYKALSDLHRCQELLGKCRG